MNMRRSCALATLTARQKGTSQRSSCQICKQTYYC
jgi:hypothetical protein